jgi:hypothetical protein
MAQAHLHDHAFDDHGFFLATCTAELPSPITATFSGQSCAGTPHRLGLATGLGG